MFHSTGLVTKFTKNIKSILFISDIILLNICFFIARFIAVEVFKSTYKIPNDLFPFILYSNLIWVLLTKVFSSYSLMRFESAVKIISKTLNLNFVYLIILFLDIFFFRYIQISVLFISVYSVIFSILFISSRITEIFLLKNFRKQGVNNKKVIIVGVNSNSLKLSKTLQRELSFGYQILGFFVKNSTEKESIKGTPITGYFEDIFSFCKQNEVDEIYFSSENYDSSEIKKIIVFCESNFIRFKIIPNFQEYTFNRRLTIDFYGDNPILNIRKEPLENQSNKISKRLFDLTFSISVILLIYPWLFPIVIIIQKITSKGPVFFIQKRSGQDNNVFNCIKFRTMTVNEFENSKGTLKNDPRITSFGKILRKTRIDELPQFMNVFLGHMSVVGPRPHMLKHTEEYSKLVDEFLVRHFVKPGITGWAQTTGYIDETKKLQEMKDKVKKDIWYIENWSFALDLRIIAMTIINIFSKDKNAY